MLQEPPSRSRWASWLLVAFFALLIFATIPLARALVRAVDVWMGEEVFLWAVGATLVAVGVWTLRGLARSHRLTPSRWLWIGGVALGYAAYAWSLRRDPVEAVHFVEYGVLGVLAFRALSHTVRDPSIYLSAALVGGTVGALDEAIQWATPGRVWDLRDIWFDFLGAAGVQLAIGAGIRPAFVGSRLTAQGLRTLCRVALVGGVLLGASLLNTPARIEAYASRVPALGFLLESSDVMLEYGHVYEIEGVGRFRSRFSPEELARVDAERGVEAGRILAGASDADYSAFLAEYTPITDPFVHEARVHLFRRDRYLETSTWYPDDPEHRRLDLTVGHRENEFLERHLPNTLRHSGRALPPEQLAILQQDQIAEMDYESRVSENVVTSVGEGQVMSGFAVLLLGLVWGERAAGRAARVAVAC